MKIQRRVNPRQEMSDLFENLDKWGTFILANILWVIFSIPLITLPVATAGLFAVMSSWVRGKPPDLFPVFFGAMRRYWLRSTFIALIDLLVGGLVIINLSIFSVMDMSNLLAFLSRSVTIFAVLMLMLTNLYIWSMMVVLDLPLRKLVETSFSLVFAHFFWSVGILVAVLVPLAISLYFLPVAAFIIATGSCVAYAVNWGTWRIIRQYLSDEERQQLESRH